jgi:hypothetical protein
MYIWLPLSLSLSLFLPVTPRINNMIQVYNGFQEFFSSPVAHSLPFLVGVQVKQGVAGRIRDRVATSVYRDSYSSSSSR